MAILDKVRISATTAVKVVEWTGNNLEEIEGLIGIDVIKYDSGNLWVAGLAVPIGYNIVATASTAYDAGPPVVTFVPGVVVEVLSDAQLAAKYEDPA